MGRGRAPCCEKVGLKRGPWTPAEDMRLMAYIHKHGHGNWRALPKQAGLLRCGKSCRLRWINYLRPDVKRGNFTPQEEETIIRLHELLGNKWSKIASRLPGRTDNEIKNVWNTHLKKRLPSKETNPAGDHKPKSGSISSPPSPTLCIDKGDVIAGKEQIKTTTKCCDLVLMEDTHTDPMEMPVQLLMEDTPLNFKEAKQSLSPVPSSSSVKLYSLHLDSAHGKEQAGEQQPSRQSGRIAIHDVKEECSIQIPKASSLDKIDCLGDFWNALDDDLQPFLSSTPAEPMDGDQGIQTKTTSMVEESNEIDGKMWISYLENELGLSQAMNKSLSPPCPGFDGDQPDFEFDPIVAYFHGHPSSPAIFSS